MSKKIFHQSLQDLHAELKKTEFDDQGKKVFSGQLIGDVQTVLEHPGEVPFLHHYNLMNRLQEAALEFKASHPDLTAVVIRVTDALNKMGI